MEPCYPQAAAPPETAAAAAMAAAAAVALMVIMGETGLTAAVVALVRCPAQKAAMAERTAAAAEAEAAMTDPAEPVGLAEHTAAAVEAADLLHPLLHLAEPVELTAETAGPAVH